MTTKEYRAKINNLHYCEYQDEICPRSSDTDCNDCPHDKDFACKY